MTLTLGVRSSTINRDTELPRHCVTAALEEPDPLGASRASQTARLSVLACTSGRFERSAVRPVLVRDDGVIGVPPSGRFVYWPPAELEVLMAETARVR